MANNAIRWLAENLKLLSALAAVVVFIIWDMRRRSLEITKLKLEISKLREESRIYRPTQAEIEKVLRGSRDLPSRIQRLIGGGKELGEFANELDDFTLQLSAYYGDPSSRAIIAQRKLLAAVQNRTVPYQGAFDKHPNPERVISLWKISRERAIQILEPDLIRTIDSFLGRFSHDATTA
jgi:hypothetical protein